MQAIVADEGDDVTPRSTSFPTHVQSWPTPNCRVRYADSSQGRVSSRPEGLKPRVLGSSGPLGGTTASPEGGPKRDEGHRDGYPDGCGYREGLLHALGGPGTRAMQAHSCPKLWEGVQWVGACLGPDAPCARAWTRLKGRA